MILEADPASPAEPRRQALHLLRELAPRRTFSRDTEIGVQGQPCTVLYVIAEGQVLLSRCGAGEEPHALELLGPGDLFGEGALQPERVWLVTARAVTEAQAYALPAAQLTRLSQYYPQLSSHILTLLSGRLKRAHRGADLVTTASARERILRLLCLLAEYHGRPRDGETWLPLTLTQTELGHMIHLTRETVARTLSELEREGVISRHGRKGLWLRATA
jgi:CRP/FNR family transcriptional regulator, cyclic AMP receptor protein